MRGQATARRSNGTGETRNGTANHARVAAKSGECAAGMPRYSYGIFEPQWLTAEGQDTAAPQQELIVANIFCRSEAKSKKRDI